MASFDNGVSPPGGASYMAPLLSFSNFSNWAADDPYKKTFDEQQKQLNQQKLQQGQQQADLASAFKEGIPRDAQGNPDYQKIAAVLAQKGDIGALTQLAPLIQQSQAASTPLYGGSPGAAPGAPQQAAGGPQPQGGPAPDSVAARPLPAPGRGPQGDSGGGTITSMVTDKLPSQNLTTGQTILKVAELMGIDPNADLTPGQQRRAQGLIARYAPEIAGPSAGSGAGSSGSKLPPSANAGSPAPGPGVGDAAGRPGAEGGGPTAAPGPASPQGGAVQAGGQPITPQVPLPPGFTDPMQAINALRDRAAKLEAANPRTKPIADRLNAQADAIEKSLQPLSVGPSTTLVDPRTSKTLYQGPAAAQLAATTGAQGSPTLDADAEAYRQTGKLPPGMGRGIQGSAEAHAIRSRAAEQEIADGGNPADWANRWQSFGAQATGKRALEQRAAGLSLAENEASSLIPRVRDISKSVSRTQFPNLNSLILAAQKGSGGENVIKLGVAVESLIPVYAKVLKPVGTVGAADMERAHDILNKAWSDGQINAALDQMEVELKSARTALDKTMSDSENRGKKKDASSSKIDDKATKPDADGWVSLPNGARIREVK